MFTHAKLAALNQLSLTDMDVHAQIRFAAVLPEQFFDPPYARVQRPEAALMRAVLEEALSCFLYQFYLSSPQGQQLAREAEEWFFSDATSWPFAFENICTVLHLDPEYIRRGLRNWKVTGSQKIHHRKRRVIGTRRALSLVA